MTLEKAIKIITQANSPGDLFTGSHEEQAKLYKELAKVCHPDRVRDPASRSKAELAFKKLSNFFASRNGKPTVITTLGKWDVIRPIGKGDIADVYLARVSENSSVSTLKEAATALKIVRNPMDNELIHNERNALKALWKGKNSYTKYLPKIVDSFEASGRATNVLSIANQCFSLKEIKGVYPDGLDFRHAVWMMNRLLSILGFAHNEGYVHGSITPDHLLYRPSDHGLVLIDWICAIKSGSGQHIPLLIDRWKPHYPPEVVRKKPATPATDIYMAAECINYAVNGNRPRRFKGIFDHCWAGSPSSRPADAWELQDKWTALAEQEYGSPKFVALEIPIH